ncbi:hypothetical protein AMTRI_Chr02g213700 [Amborella trichopoda]|uniref:Uncharacterized protein n=2 Tax=Amborella trichopoda TaxID=13333 RepID=U5CP62_AMBTC|nr:hypothetical protein AMTR_s00032p00210660 [Amborella trichopoda]
MIIERTITIHYLDQATSMKLLSKFPDASAYDFDYQQSGIWSPLPPHPFSGGPFSENPLLPPDISLLLSEKPNLGKTKRLLAPEGSAQNLMEKFRKVKKEKRKKKASLSSPAPVNRVTKGWSRALRAASKCFKKQYGSSLRLHLPNNSGS